MAVKMRDADFLCDQCGAPIKIDWESHRVMFGDFEDKLREMTCEYCASVYKVNPHEFYAYYKNKSWIVRIIRDKEVIISKTYFREFVKN